MDQNPLAHSTAPISPGDNLSPRKNTDVPGQQHEDKGKKALVTCEISSAARVVPNQQHEDKGRQELVTGEISSAARVVPNQQHEDKGRQELVTGEISSAARVVPNQQHEDNGRQELVTAEIRSATRVVPETLATDTDGDTFDDDDDSQNSELDGSNPPCSRKDTIKQRDSRRVNKKKEVNYEYEPDLKKRTKIVTGRGPTLKRLANEIHCRTKAQVFLKVQYASAGRRDVYKYEFGEDFKIEGSATEADVEATTKGGVGGTNQGGAEGTDSLLSQGSASNEGVGLACVGGMTRMGQRDSSPTSTQTLRDESDLFDSPHAAKHRGFPRRKNSGRPGCSICGGNDPFIMIDDMKVDAIFFTCASEPCSAKIHNDCAGFPGMEYNKDVMPYWCKVHRGAGRGPVEYSKQPQLSPAPTPPSTGFVLPGRTRSKSGGRAAVDQGTHTPCSGRKSRGTDKGTPASRRRNKSGEEDNATAKTTRGRGAGRGGGRGRGGGKAEQAA